MQAIDPDTGNFAGAGHAASLEPALRLEFQARLNQHRPFRLAIVGVLDKDLELGVSCWDLPATAEYSTVFSTWTPQLRAACFAALKREGNARRQRLVTILLRGEANEASSHRRYVAIKRASYLETYWSLPDLEAARRLLRVRLDNAAVRDVVLRSGRGNRGDARVANRVLRACYCCEAINGQAGVFHPETIDHTLLHCAAHDARRQTFKAAIRALVADQAAVDLVAAASAPSPPFEAGGDAAATAWLTVMKLCTGLGPTSTPAVTAVSGTATPRPPTAPIGPLTVAQVTACARRDAPDLTWNSAAGVATARWVAALNHHWAQSMRPPWLDAALGRREPAPQLATSDPTPGYRLAMLVANYSRDIFYTRRKILHAADSEYALLARDPPRPTKPPKPTTPPSTAPKAHKAKQKPPAKRKPRPPPPAQGPPAKRNPRPPPPYGAGRVVIVPTRRMIQLPAPVHSTVPGPTAFPNRPASSVAQLQLGGAPPSAPYMPTL